MICKHFNGWDWTELATEWGVYIPDSYAGVGMCEYVKKSKTEQLAGIKDDSGLEIDWSDTFYEPFEEYDPIIWYIAAVLRSYDGANSTRAMKKMAHDVRCFALKLGESEYTYTSPLWSGLAQIQDDWTILSVISGSYPLIAMMWD